MKVELLNNNELENRIKIVATAGKLSRTKGTVFDVLDSSIVYEKNIGLVKRIISMGHKSIMEHDYLVFAISNVTPIIEQTIISYRLTSFTIKSGREVDFRNVGYYTPTFHDKTGKVLKNNKELQKKYQEHMDYLFNNYGYYVDKGVKEEDARFVLPYSFNTNIVMGLDARELEKMIVSFLYGKNSNISEIKELGEILFDIVKKQIPYLTEEILKHKNDAIIDFDEYIINNNITKFNDVKLLNHTKDIDKTITKSAIMYRNQCDEKTYHKIIKELKEKNPNIEETIMAKIKNSSEQRELEQVNFQFQIPISLIILKHLTRHRMQSLLVPDFVPMWNLKNYITPETIRKIDEKKYQNIHNKNYEIYTYFKSNNVRDEDLIYFYLCGQSVNVYTSLNGRTLEWISRMRTCNKAHWEIRKIARTMINQVKEIAPLYGTLLGPTCEVFNYCPEGKESCKLKRIEK